MKKTNTLLTKEEIIEKIQSEKKFLSERYFVSEIGLFGSYIRGEQKVNSDIDILVEFSSYPDLFTYVEIIDYLKSKLRRKVDLTTISALRPEISKRILKEVQYL